MTVDRGGRKVLKKKRIGRDWEGGNTYACDFPAWGKRKLEIPGENEDGTASPPRGEFASRGGSVFPHYEGVRRGRGGNASEGEH